jgi:hypothetical protein
MSYFTYVLAITDKIARHKYEMQYTFFRNVKGFQGMHFVDGTSVWHGPQVIDILWQQASTQQENAMTELGACNFTTPKMKWLGSFFCRAIHEECYWVNSGLCRHFWAIDNEIFLNYKRKYVKALADSNYLRQNHALQKPPDKNGYSDFSYADSLPECKQAAKKVDSVLHCMRRHADNLAEIYYQRIRKAKKYLYCFEFQKGNPLNDCETAWDHVKHYRLAPKE